MGNIPVSFSNTEGSNDRNPSWSVEPFLAFILENCVSLELGPCDVYALPGGGSGRSAVGERGV